MTVTSRPCCRRVVVGGAFVAIVIAVKRLADAEDKDER